MIEIKQIRTTDLEDYAFVEELLTSAFPPEEHRELTMQREFTDSNKLFHTTVILEDGSPVGLLSYWDFDRLVYVEHFAIHPTKRNGGMGKKALNKFKEKIGRPIILEVELPENEISQRRIQFYEREGFVLWEKAYQQPPYRSDDGYLPMYLMAHGELTIKNDFESIKVMLYKEVYLI